MQFSLLSATALLVAGAIALPQTSTTKDPNYGTVPNKPWYIVDEWQPGNLGLYGTLTCQPNLADSNDPNPNPADSDSFQGAIVELQNQFNQGQLFSYNKAYTWQRIYCRKGPNNIGGVKVSVISFITGQKNPYDYGMMVQAMSRIYNACKAGTVSMGAFDFTYGGKFDMLKVEKPTPDDKDCGPCYNKNSKYCS